MASRRARRYGGMLAVLLLGGASGCGASVSVGRAPTTSILQAPDRAAIAEETRAAASTTRPQRPGTCKIAPPQVNFPTGEWTARETILTTSAIDACAGERLVRPWDFRRICHANTCKTYLYTASYYGPVVAEIAPDGRERYVATFQPSTVPCPHRPGENAGIDRDYSTMTLWWSSHRQILHGLSRDHQAGPCDGGPDDTSGYVATRTNPAANPPAEGP
jgi:hypothetical protein